MPTYKSVISGGVLTANNGTEHEYCIPNCSESTGTTGYNAADPGDFVIVAPCDLTVTGIEGVNKYQITANDVSVEVVKWDGTTETGSGPKITFDQTGVGNVGTHESDIDSANPLSVDKGEMISVKVDRPSGASSQAYIWWSIQIESEAGIPIFWSSAGVTPAAYWQPNMTYSLMGGFASSGWAVNSNNYQPIWPCSGTIKDPYVLLPNGSWGQDLTFFYRSYTPDSDFDGRALDSDESVRNTGEEPYEFTISSGSTTYSGTQSESITEGDVAQWRIFHNNGTDNAMCISCVFVPDTDGEVPLASAGHVTDPNPSGSAVHSASFSNGLYASDTNLAIYHVYYPGTVAEIIGFLYHRQDFPDSATGDHLIGLRTNDISAGTYGEISTTGLSDVSHDDVYSIVADVASGSGYTAAGDETMWLQVDANGYTPAVYAAGTTGFGIALKGYIEVEGGAVTGPLIEDEDEVNVPSIVNEQWIMKLPDDEDVVNVPTIVNGTIGDGPTLNSITVLNPATGFEPKDSSVFLLWL